MNEHTMPYTMPEILLFVGALSAAAVAIINAWRNKATVDALTTVGAKVDTNNVEVVKVHQLANDRATKQDALNVELQTQVKVLIATIAAQDKERAIHQDRRTQAVSVQQGVEQEQARTGSEKEPSGPLSSVPEVIGIITEPNKPST